MQKGTHFQICVLKPAGEIIYLNRKFAFLWGGSKHFNPQNERKPLLLH